MRKRLAYSWQNISLIAIGIIALITVLTSLLTPIGRGIKALSLSDDISVQDPQFLSSIGNLTNAPVRNADSLLILNNGDAFLASAIADISAAKHTITASNYIWEDGKMMNQIFDTLIAKQKEGIKVRLLIDANGGKKVSDDKVAALKEAGGEVVMFRPGIPGKFTVYHKRMHRRVLVIDGTIAYTGGVGFADRWLGNARNKDEWRDIMVRVTGDAASGIQATFADLWAASEGEIPTGDTLYPPQKQTGNIKTITIGSSPVQDIGLLSKFFAASILSAQKSVFITTPYFIPDKSIRTALIQKAREGVDVELVLPNRLIDTKSVRLAGQSFYAGLLDAGVHIYEYQPTFIHSKYMVIDGTWSVVGSANIDNRSMYLNEESVISVWNTNFGNEMVSLFNQDKAGAVEITRESWSHRGIVTRLQQGFWKAFAQQF